MATILNREIFKHINVKWNSGRTVVDTCYFFSSKLSVMLLLTLNPFLVHNLNLSDVSPSVTIHSFTDASLN